MLKTERTIARIMIVADASREYCTDLIEGQYATAARPPSPSALTAAAVFSALSVPVNVNIPETAPPESPEISREISEFSRELLL